MTDTSSATHTQSNIGFFEDEYSMSVGFSGALNGKKNDAILQASKEFDEQDIASGQDTIHFEYNGIGDYELVKSVTFSMDGDPSFCVAMNEQTARENGIPYAAIRFELVSMPDENTLNLIKKICSATGTPLLSS